MICCFSKASIVTRGSTSGGPRRRSFVRRSSESMRHASPATRSPAESRRGLRQPTASASTSRCGRHDPRSPLGVSFTSSPDAVEPAAWKRLAERAGHVFATRGWLLTWWRHYGKARRQLIGVARTRDDAKERGWRTLFLPTVDAAHASEGSSPGVPSRHSLLLLESQHRYARKHFGATQTALLRATLVAIDSARFVRYALARRVDRRSAALERTRVHLMMQSPRPS